MMLYVSYAAWLSNSGIYLKCFEGRWASHSGGPFFSIIMRFSNERLLRICLQLFYSCLITSAASRRAVHPTSPEAQHRLTLLRLSSEWKISFLETREQYFLSVILCFSWPRWRQSRTPSLSPPSRRSELFVWSRVKLTDPISIRLQIFSIHTSKLPFFEAVSYTWGGSSEKKPVICSGSKCFYHLERWKRVTAVPPCNELTVREKRTANGQISNHWSSSVHYLYLLHKR